MSRKLLVLVVAVSLAALAVAMVQAQDPFRRSGSSASTEGAAAPARPATLAERLLAARRSAPLEDEKVSPAAALDSGSSSRRSARPADPREPSAFMPDANPEAIDTARSAESGDETPAPTASATAKKPP